MVHGLKLQAANSGLLTCQLFQEWRIGTMSKFGSLLKISALGAAVALSAQVNAATFQVPANYSLEVVDGQETGYNYSQFSRTLELGPGRHQLVLLFEGTFGNSSQSQLVQASDPIVVEIANMPADANYTFTYQAPDDVGRAHKFAREQQVTLVDADTHEPLPASAADYYILTTDAVSSNLRNYRIELAALGLLYAPAAHNSQQVREEVNAQGVRVVQVAPVLVHNDAGATDKAAPESNAAGNQV